MRKVAIVAGIIAAIALTSYAIFFRTAGTSAEPTEVDYSTVLLTKPYTNDTFHFSLSIPGNFVTRQLEADESGATTVLLESADQADGVQVVVTPFDEDISSLTVERIQQDVPDLVITDPQPVQIGENNTGLAFKSNNDAFDGESREVWFVFRGNLYQISTYERLDPLLKKIFSTWKFF